MAREKSDCFQSVLHQGPAQEHLSLSAPSTKQHLRDQPENAETRDRTRDLQIFSLTLSQLSYRGSCS